MSQQTDRSLRMFTSLGRLNNRVFDESNYKCYLKRISSASGSIFLVTLFYEEPQNYRQEECRGEVDGLDLLREEEVEADAEDYYIAYEAHVADECFREESR